MSESECNPHPKAPHGLNREASYTNGRYTCVCEGWDAYEAGYQNGYNKCLEADHVPDTTKMVNQYQNEIIVEMAIQGHASTRDAIRWAINQERERLTDAAMKAAEKAVDVAIKLEREACALICDEFFKGNKNTNYSDTIAICIRARDYQKGQTD